MRVYTVHLPPPFSAKQREAIVIGEGFNWWAFVFSGLWAFANRMWLLGIALLLVTGVLAAGVEHFGLGEDAAAVITLALAVVIGAHANDWHRAHLARKGWKQVGPVAAADRDGALRRYLDLAALGAS